MAPEPTLCFTLPSLSDGILLDCRIYHPQSLIPSPKSPPWKRHAAIMAHPYAPLGGCYDDSVVEMVTETLLKVGYLVGTFNFRGAGKSAGRTSWTGKPEQGDYMSLVGFIAYYTHFLDPFRPHASALESLKVEDPSSSRPTDPAEQPVTPVLLMAGYSYGAMIATQLPPLGTIMSRFARPKVGSPEAEIRLRAQHLAEAQNIMLSKALAAKLEAHHPSSPRSLQMRIGFSEGSMRKSHEFRRSLSLDEAEAKLKRGVHELLSKAKAGQKTSHQLTDPESASTARLADDHIHLEPLTDIQPRKPSYILISPLQGPVSHLIALDLKSSPIGTLFSRRSPPTTATSENSSDGLGESDREAPNLKAKARQKLVDCATMAAFGDNDGFVSVKRLRDWVTKLKNESSGLFVAHEITTAGHFWVEEGVAYHMCDRVREFASELVAAP